MHEWKGTFHNENVTFKMTSVCGHVMALDFVGKWRWARIDISWVVLWMNDSLMLFSPRIPGKYNSWDKVDPVELFTCPTEKKEATAKLRMPAFLSQEAKDCQYLILWLDCDKEGENICFEVMDAVSRSIKNVCEPVRLG